MELSKILFFLDTIFLQARPTGNPIADFFTGIFNPTPPVTGSESVIITPSYIPIVSFIIILFFVTIFLRYIINARKYPNAESPIGNVEFMIMGQGRVEMSVSQYNAPLRPSIIRSLKKNPKFAPAVNELLKLRDEHKLFFYQAYYRHVRDLITSTVRRRRIPPLIISTASLEDPEILYTQSDPKFSWASLTWETMKTCILHSSTEKIDGETPDGDDMDIWLIAPIPDVKERSKYERTDETEHIDKKLHVFGSDFIPHEKSINIDVLPYSDELAKVASSMVSASKQVNYLEKLEEHIETQDDDMAERDNIINRLRSKANTLKVLVGQKKLIGVDIPQAVFKPKEIIQWIGLTIMAIIFMGLLPTLIPAMAGIDRTLLELFGGIIIFALYMATRKSTRKETQDLMEDEGIDINANV